MSDSLLVRWWNDYATEQGNWDEVEQINRYAVFMGYLSMAVRGLRYLVLTWTTVVLLGGFVSMLEKKDFWSLTVITLVQTIGVFDVSLNEKLSNVGYCISGFLFLMGHHETGRGKHVAFKLVVTMVQVLVFAIILCPLGAVYVFGLVMSTGISLWRLIQHDYVYADGDPSKANLMPALDVLYSVALLQGALFSYWAIFSTKGKNLVKAVSESYGFDKMASQSVMDYFHETRVGCEKDPSFARGRNLVTYAMNLMESSSSDSYVSGARIMDALVGPRPGLSQSQLYKNVKQQLLESPSVAQLLRKLLRTLDSKMPYGQEARERAAAIVEHLADAIYLTQFPEGLQCIASLLEPDEKLALQLHGVRILQNLTAADVNRGAMRDATGLVSKVTENVNSHGKRGCDDHDTWSKIAWPSLSLLLRLMDDTPGGGSSVDTLRRQGKNAISNSAMESILKCDKCDDAMQTKVMKILEDRHGNEARRNLIAIMVNIFAQGKKDRVRGWGRQKLEEMMLSSSQSESTTAASIILLAKEDAVANLTQILVDDRNSTFKYRIPAAHILESLCSHYDTMDDECLKKLKKAMTESMPKVLGEVLQIQKKLRAAATDKLAEADFDPGSQYMEARLLLEALVSVCATVCKKMTGADLDLAYRLDEIVAHQTYLDAAKPVNTYAAFVKEAQERLDEKKAY